MQNIESPPEHTSHVSAVNSSNWRAKVVTIVITALIAGMGGYLLGIKTNQTAPRNSQRVSFDPSPAPTKKPSPTPFVPKTLNSLPTIEPADPELVANWKTYTNARWGISFKYPETWFPKEVPQSSQRGGFDFYSYWVTPHPGRADYPTNAMFNVEISSDGHQTDAQFMNTAFEIPGYQKTLSIAGKLGIKTKWQYYIKLSNTNAMCLILTAFNEDGNRELDSVVSTLEFTNE
jgi:hypothetical protein